MWNIFLWSQILEYTYACLCIYIYECKLWTWSISMFTCVYMTKKQIPKQEQSLLFQVLCILIYVTNNRWWSQDTIVVGGVGQLLSHVRPFVTPWTTACLRITMNKASGGDGIPAELFQILKEDTVKVLHSICQQIWKTQQWPQDWNRSVFIPIPKKGNINEWENYCTIAPISHASKDSCPKPFKSGFNSTWTKNSQMYRLDLEKAEEQESKLPTSAGSKKKQKNSRETSISASLTMLKPLTLWITTNCGKFLKRWKYQDPWPACCKTCMQVKKQQSEPDMEEWTGSKLGKQYVKAVYCHSAYLTYMQSTSCKCWAERSTGWRNLECCSPWVTKSCTWLSDWTTRFDRKSKLL